LVNRPRRFISGLNQRRLPLGGNVFRPFLEVKVNQRLDLVKIKVNFFFTASRGVADNFGSFQQPCA
jgi:hypothetical protein